MRTVWRSFNTPLTEVVSDPKTIEKIKTHLDFLTVELRKLTSDAVFMRTCEKHKGESRGDFWNHVTQESHKPHLTWTCEGQRAKYYRMFLERIRVQQESQDRRVKVATICDTYNYDLNNLLNIRLECTNQSIYPTNKEIENICRDGKIPSFPTNLNAFLDYTCGDKQVVTQNSLNYSIEVAGEWFDLTIPEPSYLREHTDRFSKPIIQYDSNHNIIIRISYEISIKDIDSQDNAVLGVDLGKIKPFSSAITYLDHSYSTELTYSKELAHLSSKIDVLSSELKYLYSKKDNISTLLKGKDNSYLVQHYLDLENQIWFVKHKRTLLKEQSAWLIARDIINHCIDNKVKEIHIEDLGFLIKRSGEQIGGKWDYARVQSRISELGEFYGIQVVQVNAKNSSHTDPFSSSFVDPNSKRLIILTDGSKLDRDYAAALELSLRPSKKNKNKKKNIIKQKSCRDKFAPTTKRPKVNHTSKKRFLKEVKKYESGESFIVASSGKARIIFPPYKTFGLAQSITTYTQVLQL